MIKILSRSKCRKESHKPYKKNIISITDLGSPNPKFSTFEKLLTLKFDDEDVDSPMAPQLEHIVKICNFINSINISEEEQLLVHCEAGICRSSATALVAYAMKFGFKDILEYFKPEFGLIFPNSRIIELADNYLGLNGELISTATFINSHDILRGL